MTRREFVKRKLNEKRVSWVDTFLDSMYPKKMPENYLKNNENNTQVVEKKSEKYNNNNKKAV